MWCRALVERRVETRVQTDGNASAKAGGKASAERVWQRACGKALSACESRRARNLLCASCSHIRQARGACGDELVITCGSLATGCDMWCRVDVWCSVWSSPSLTMQHVAAFDASCSCFSKVEPGHFSKVDFSKVGNMLDAGGVRPGWRGSPSSPRSPGPAQTLHTTHYTLLPTHYTLHTTPETPIPKP